MMSHAESGSSLQVFTARSGALSAYVEFTDGTIRHLHSTVDPEKEAVYFRDIPLWGSAVIFLGTGLGYHLPLFLGQCNESNRRIIIEYYDLLIDYCMQHHVPSGESGIIALSSTNHGPMVPLVREMLRTLDRHAVQIIRHPASYDIHAAFYDTLLRSLWAPHASDAIRHKGVKRNAAAKTRIWKPLMLHGDFFIQEELKKAAESLCGAPPALFEYQRYTAVLHFEAELQRCFQRTRPDCILSINMKGFDAYGILSGLSRRFDVPVIIWFVDDPHPILYPFREHINTNMHAFCWEKTYLSYLQKNGFGSVSLLPLAGDTTLFNGSLCGRHAIPLGFVGSSMGGAFLEKIKRNLVWDDSLEPIVRSAADCIAHTRTIPVMEAIRQACSGHNMPLPFSDEKNVTWFCSYVVHYASMKKRQRLVQALAPLHLEIVGDREDWKSIAAPSCVIHAPVDYRRGLNAIYRSIAVTVNSTSCQMPTAVNQRVFDVPLSGGFVLSDGQEDMQALFEIGREAVTYSGIADCVEKIDYYQHHETERFTIIKNARRRIEEQHLYIHRMKTMLSMI